MPVKLLQLNACSMCCYRQMAGYDAISYKCHRMGRIIPNIAKIPGWCPLPDQDEDIEWRIRDSFKFNKAEGLRLATTENLKLLGLRSRAVVNLKLNENWSWEQIGEFIGRTRERARQIYWNALFCMAVGKKSRAN